MSHEHGKDDLEAAAKMIEGAFGDSPVRDHPLGFISEPPFLALISDIEAVFDKHDVSSQEFLCALTEMLMRSTAYRDKAAEAGLLAARAAPIIRQLVYEHKQAPEILVVISAMLTHLALHARNKPREP